MRLEARFFLATEITQGTRAVVNNFFNAFLFMNSKRYTPMLQTEGGSGARVQFVLYGYLLPAIRFACALPRSPALHGVYHNSWTSSSGGVRLCVLRVLAFGYWDVGSLFSGA